MPVLVQHFTLPSTLEPARVIDGAEKTVYLCVKAGKKRAHSGDGRVLSETHVYASCTHASNALTPPNITYVLYVHNTAV